MRRGAMPRALAWAGSGTAPSPSHGTGSRTRSAPSLLGGPGPGTEMYGLSQPSPAVQRPQPARPTAQGPDGVPCIYWFYIRTILFHVSMGCAAVVGYYTVLHYTANQFLPQQHRKCTGLVLLSMGRNFKPGALSQGFCLPRLPTQIHLVIHGSKTQ